MLYIKDFCKKEYGTKAKAIERRNIFYPYGKLAKKVQAFLKSEVYPFIIGYYYSPEVENYLKDKKGEIKALKSFELKIKYSRI
ncbi:MAG: hypothetical protein ACUVUG_09700 [Candidatus Aminicenantia bacterium]